MEKLTAEQKTSILERIEKAHEAFHELVEFADFIKQLNSDEITIKFSGGFSQAGSFSSISAEIDLKIPNSLFR